MKLKTCGTTDPGLTRKRNEDSYFMSDEFGLFIVADGMGGHAAGDVASRLAVETVCRVMMDEKFADPLEQLAKALRKANEAVAEEAAANPARHKMGTTLTAVYCRENRAFLGHVGDSRFYLLRAGRLLQISDDHSLVAEQLRMKLISAEEARRSTLGNLLTQAVGLNPELDICLKQTDLIENDHLLICSDGLTNMLPEETLIKHLEEHDDPKHACQSLLEDALEAGGQDNITAIVVTVERQDGELSNQPGRTNGKGGQ